jgi:hypothetical protein
VKEPQAKADFCTIKLSLGFGELLQLLHMEHEISTTNQLHDKVQPFWRLERGYQSRQKRTSRAHGQHTPLNHCSINIIVLLRRKRIPVPSNNHAEKRCKRNNAVVPHFIHPLTTTVSLLSALTA